MGAEEIIKATTNTLTERHKELLSLYAESEKDILEDFILNELALIEIELKNRGFAQKWMKD